MFKPQLVAGLIATLALGAQAADVLDAAISRFVALASYRATVRSVGTGGEGQLIRYGYRKPGWVRMAFVRPHAGAVLVYDPGARKVRLWPFGVGYLPVLTLSPDNALIRGEHGHRVDRSDVGALLANLAALRDRGSAAPLGDAAIGEQRVTGVEVKGAGDANVAGVHRYRVWFARDTLFPARVESYGVDGQAIETVMLEDVERDVAFPDDFFRPER
ncbi:LolA family protein [Crenobacter cavernae]|uniref:DUF1571 domain-containing protein n=1 Tax=Crenobacter cavernae TaxID=2290923 RepID=A0A345YAE2_9NEIS|nr:hypothetical protein [Crenobacter cavernae]AXK40894.1 hypothetical protein DWG20_12950 [Crenobacter cavernae]